VRGPHPADLIVPEIVPQTAPAAGASFAYTCEPTWIQRLLCVTCTFVTDANVADRTLRLEYVTTGGLTFYREIQGGVQQATTTARLSWQSHRGAADFDTNGFVVLPLLSCWLTGSQQVQLNVTNIQATDALSAIVFTWERYTSDEFDALRRWSEQ
jgi:hypothetical protein